MTDITDQVNKVVLCWFWSCGHFPPFLRRKHSSAFDVKSSPPASDTAQGASPLTKIVLAGCCKSGLNQDQSFGEKAAWLRLHQFSSPRWKPLSLEVSFPWDATCVGELDVWYWSPGVPGQHSALASELHLDGRTGS